MTRSLFFFICMSISLQYERNRLAMLLSTVVYDTEANEYRNWGESKLLVKVP